MTLLECTAYANSCCPQPVAISIAQTIVKTGENAILADQFNDTVVGTQLSLTHTPWNRESLSVYVAGVPQRYGTDFSIIGSVVTFAVALVGQQVLIPYMYIDSGSDIVTFTTGMAMTLMIDDAVVANIPNGFLIMDGGLLQGQGAGLGYLRASYPDLYDAVGDTFGGGDGSTTFLDVVVSEATYIGSTLHTYYKVIKT